LVKLCPVDDYKSNKQRRTTTLVASEDKKVGFQFNTKDLARQQH